MQDLHDLIMRTADEVGECLRQAPEKPNLDAFRRLQRYCSHGMFTEKESRIRLICFFLSDYIGMVFSNLGGDTPYDKILHKTRVAMFDFASNQLKLLATAIQDQNDPAILSCLEQLVSRYVEDINYLNTIDQD